VDQLNGITVCQSGFGQPRTPDDLTIELEYDGTSVEAEVPEQVGGRGGAGQAARLAVNDDLKLTH